MAWYSFGPFVLDPSARVLRRDGHPVAITAKIFELLVLLVEGCGQVVAKDELLAKLWPDTTVEEANLAQSISVLRKILCDNPQEHRYIVTIPGRGYAFVAPVTLVNPLQKTPADETSPFRFSSTYQPKFRRRIASGVLLAAASIGAILLTPKRVEPAFEDPVPLTTFRGMEGNPAVSPDGNHVAFTWNGEKQHNFDIYVMPIPSGVPVRLTSDPADDVSPAWSPDGRTIAFLRRVGGERGALLLVPAAGGPEHKLREIRDLALREPPEG
jgi:DNA-binding winged helix-turn-helix (wHTH) protein